MCSKLLSTAQSENSSQSIGILHQLCFQNNYSMLSVKGQLQRFDKLRLFNRFRHVENGFDIKATSHSTIFDIPMRPLREDQKHRHRFTR